MRQFGIEKSKRVRWFDDTHAGRALSIDNLITKSLHPSPMHLGTEMMLSVIAVKEPDPIVKLLVTAHAPGEWLVRVAAIVAVVTVEIGKAMAEIPKRKKETDVVPVKDAENDERGNEQR